MKKNRKEIRKARKKRFLRVYQSLPPERQIRLCVTRTAQHLIAQIVRDEKRETLATATTLERDFRESKQKGVERAKKLGELIAQRSLKQGVESVVFDRNGFIYKGQIKALAEAAREAGLKF
jgi:large subunit ribosomal protein L18